METFLFFVINISLKTDTIKEEQVPPSERYPVFVRKTRQRDPLRRILSNNLNKYSSSASINCLQVNEFLLRRYLIALLARKV